jgi:uncharacterized membrane protein YbhN (UPF0104 family)
MSRRRWISLGVALVAVGVAVVLLARDEEARAALRLVSLAALGLVFLTQAVNVVTDSVRYQMVVPARFRAAIPWWRWHSIFAVGRLLNMAVPQSGMAYRAARLRLEHDMPVSSFVGGVAAISWLGNGVALVLTAAVLAVVGEPVAALVVAGIGAVLVALVGLLPRLAGSNRRRRLRLPDRLARVAAGLGESFVELASTPGRLARVLAVSVVTQLSGVVGFVLVSHALGLESPVLVGAVLYTSATIVTVVSLTPGGLGITELAAAIAAGALGVGAGTGVAVALVIRVTGTVALAVLAAVASAADRSAADRSAAP